MFQLHKEKLGRGKESKSRFLGRKIREEIGELVNELQIGTDVHFIRCIKPNEEKKAFTFVPKMALTQIRYLGLLDTILLRKATYHVRVPYEKFYEAYSII
jgi:myosin heavy subunit